MQYESIETSTAVLRASVGAWFAVAGVGSLLCALSPEAKPIRWRCFGHVLIIAWLLTWTLTQDPRPNWPGNPAAGFYGVPGLAGTFLLFMLGERFFLTLFARGPVRKPSAPPALKRLGVVAITAAYVEIAIRLAIGNGVFGSGVESRAVGTVAIGVLLLASGAFAKGVSDSLRHGIPHRVETVFD